YDHTAALKLIEWRWGLPPLTARDASGAINNPAASFNFTSPSAALQPLPQVSPVFAPPCFEGGIFSSSSATRTAGQQPVKAGKPNEFTALANASTTREFVSHPRFRANRHRPETR
ncbi:MAG: hypothetical protein JO319_17380, partial [Acidobacteriaceae bacterium]|nr:hypothetical protein [Acidobacteriaceae bacterium]